MAKKKTTKKKAKAKTTKVAKPVEEAPVVVEKKEAVK